MRSRRECRFKTQPTIFPNLLFLFLCAFVPLCLCYFVTLSLSPFSRSPFSFFLFPFSFLLSPQLVVLVFLCSIFPAGVVVTGIVPGIVPGNIKLNQCELAALCQYISVAVLSVSVNGRFCLCTSVAIFVCVRLWLFLSVYVCGYISTRANCSSVGSAQQYQGSSK